MREGQPSQANHAKKGYIITVVAQSWMDVHDPCLLLVYAAIFSNIIKYQCTISGTEQIIAITHYSAVLAQLEASK